LRFGWAAPPSVVGTDRLDRRVTLGTVMDVAPIGRSLCRPVSSSPQDPVPQEPTHVTVAAENLDLDTIGEAAVVLAQTLGLGAQVSPIDDWSTDDGDQVISAQVTCDPPFQVFLAVDQSIGTSLLADLDRLRAGLESAVTTLLGDSSAFTIDALGVTEGRPERFVGILGDGQLRAIFGVASTGLVGAAQSLAADADSSDRYAPRSLRASDVHASFNPGALELLHDVEMEVTVELGRTSMPIRDLLSLQPGMVVEIDRAAGAPIDVLVNGRRIASGEVVVVDEEFGVRITEILSVGDR
jgi:flagellar motor switch protein FliN